MRNKTCPRNHELLQYELSSLNIKHPDGRDWADAILNGEGQEMRETFCNSICDLRTDCHFYGIYTSKNLKVGL